MARHLKPTRIFAGALLTVSLLGGAACSSDDDDGGGDSAAVTTTTISDSPAGEQEYLDGFVAGITSDGIVSQSQGDCIGTAWMDLIGLDALLDSEMTPEQFGEIDPQAYRELELSDEKANALFDLMKPCGFDLAGGLRSPSSPNVTEPEQACVDEVASDENVRAAVVAGMTEPGGENKLAELQAEVQACLDS